MPQYKYTFTGTVSADIIVTTVSVLSLVSGEPGSSAYAVTSITGTWDEQAITGMYGLGNTFAQTGRLNYDNAIFPAGAGGTDGIDNAGIAFTLPNGTIVNVYTESGSFCYIDSTGATGDLNIAFYIPPCYIFGTHILTDCGEVAVQNLRAGNLVVTVSGRFAPNNGCMRADLAGPGKEGLAPVKWLGHRDVDCRRHPRPWDVWPIRVCSGAFGDGLPRSDLWLSPDHAVFIDGVLIPVRYLINGRTIAQESRDAVTYWHVELDRHDVIIAEGLPCESYLDTGNRGAFVNGGASMQLHPDFARRIWATETCAPLVLDGAELKAVRRMVSQRAAMLGHTFTRNPDLRLIVEGWVLYPETHGGVHRFYVPPAARSVRLVSRCGVPAELHDDSTDHRRLGVAVARVVCGDELIPLADSRLGSGWHDVEYGSNDTALWRWTDGNAELALSGGRALDIEVAIIGRYWLDDVAAASSW